MKSTTKAVILVAGEGKRLRPLTDDIPKCLVNVNSKSILENTLSILSKNGIKEVVLVVGYKKEKIIEKIGNSFAGMKMTFVDNDIYTKTNNIFSFWLAKNHLSEGFILIEGDILIEDTIIQKLVQSEHENVIVVDKYIESHSGLCITAKSSSVVEQMILTKDQGLDFDRRGKLKTVNIYKIAPRAGSIFFKKMDEKIAEGRINDFYEILFKGMIENNDDVFHALNIEGAKWFEIDCVEDLRIAEKLFP